MLTKAEEALVHAMFGDALDPAPVRVHRRRWWPLQPRATCMAPRGALHFHPQSTAWRACFASASVEEEAFFLHEMTHVWQHQSGMNLLLRRMPWARYRYCLRSGRPFTAYGVEQQAEIVRHTHLLRHGVTVTGAPPLASLEALLPFSPASERFARPPVLRQKQAR